MTEEEKMSVSILVVEDDPVIRVLAKRMLEEQGYTVLDFSTGEEALAVADSYSKPIHLLLTDIILPGMRGTEVAEHFARTKPDTAVLFMSGYTDDTLSRDGRLPERAHLVQKPYTPVVLLSAVREVLDQSAHASSQRHS